MSDDVLHCDERWETADDDPNLIRSFDHPTDGRYLLGSDVVAWLRDLTTAAREGTPVAAAIHAPVLDAMAETVERWLAADGVDHQMNAEAYEHWRSQQ